LNARITNAYIHNRQIVCLVVFKKNCIFAAL